MAQICVWGRISEEGKSIYIGHATHLSLASKEKSKKATHLPLNKPLPNLQPLPAPTPQAAKNPLFHHFSTIGHPRKSVRLKAPIPAPNPMVPSAPSDNLDKAADDSHMTVKGHRVNGISTKNTIVFLMLKRKSVDTYN